MRSIGTPALGVVGGLALGNLLIALRERAYADDTWLVDSAVVAGGR